MSTTGTTTPSTSYTISRNTTFSQATQSPSVPRRFTSIQSTYSKTPLKNGLVRTEPDPRNERTLEEGFLNCGNRFKVNESVMVLGRDGNYHRAEITFVGRTPLKRIVYGVHYNDMYKSDGTELYFVGVVRGREA